MIDYEIYRNKTVRYKDILCRVIQVPHSIIDYFELSPEKAIDDIGTGCGMRKRLTPMEFEVETKPIPGRLYEGV